MVPDRDFPLYFQDMETPCGGADKGYLPFNGRGRRFESDQSFGAVAQLVERETYLCRFFPARFQQQGGGAEEGSIGRSAGEPEEWVQIPPEP